MSLLSHLPMRVLSIWVSFCVFAICELPLATAQTGFASISGRVADNSGAVIQKADVTLKSLDTGVSLHTVSNNDGIYSFPSVQPGNYVMRIEKQGFRSVDVTGLTLYTQDQLARNFSLAVGSTSESITVQAGATNDNPAVSMTVTREFIENMPLNGRSFQDLIQLTPGAVSTGGTGYYSINGQRSDSNNYTVDGISANLGGYLNSSDNSTGSGLSGSSPSQTALGTTQNLVSVDSLQEFTIQTSGYAPEYGRTPGGQVQFTTRSGTNEFHGTLFNYLRNTIFDANRYENDYFGRPKTAEHQNDFGGTVDGPVVIPHFYSGKDKTFFFFSYEGLRLLLPDSESEYVPTQALRNWASPSMQPYLNASPIPNGAANQDGCTISDPNTGQPTACDALFYYPFSYPNNLDSTSVRLDQRLGKKLAAFVRYANTPSGVSSGAESVYNQTINTHTWTVGITANASSSLVNDFRFNYSYDSEEAVYGEKGVGGAVPTPRALLIPAAYDGPYATGFFDLSVPNTSLSASSQYYGTGTLLHQLQIVNGLAWIHGHHSLKFGGDWRRLTSSYGSETYLSNILIESLADVESGTATNFNTASSAPGEPVFDNVSLYAQDHWKLRENLTLDYGVRWEFNPPPGPSNGEYPATLTSTNLATAELASPGTPPYKTGYDHFAPRVGFAWNAIPSARNAVTVRGGFGIFFDTGQTTIGNAYTAGYPFSVTGPTLSEVPLPLSAAVTNPPSLNVPLSPPYPSLQGVTSPDLTLPYTEQWNLSVDESLNSKNTLTVSYVGNGGRKLLFTQLYLSVPQNQAFPNSLTLTNNASHSSYDALQIVDRGRLATGLDVVASLTWAHALDNESNDFGIDAPVWGNSDYDLRRVFNAALNYTTPSAGSDRWTRTLTHGWVFANRFSAQTGYPLNVRAAEKYLPNGQLVFFQPDLVLGLPIYLHGSDADANGKPVPGNWRLNRAAFATVPTGPHGVPVRQGTLGRNYVRDPGFWALNSAVERTFQIHEELQLLLRVDAFNTFNHPNLGNADNYLTDSTFGELNVYNQTVIGSSNALYAMGAPRSLQFSLKLRF